MIVVEGPPEEHSTLPASVGEGTAGPCFHELEAQEHPPAPDLPKMTRGEKGLAKAVEESLPHPGRAPAKGVPTDHPQGGPTRGAGDGVPPKGGHVGEGRVLGQNPESPAGAHKGPQGISAPQGLGQDQEVRGHAFLVAREHSSRPSETGHDLVQDEQGSDLAAARGQGS